MVLAIVATLTVTMSTFADGYPTNDSTGVNTDPSGVSVSANSSTTASAPGGGGPSVVHCTYTPVDPADSALLGTGGLMPGHWVYPSCTGE